MNGNETRVLLKHRFLIIILLVYVLFSAGEASFGEEITIEIKNFEIIGRWEAKQGDIIFWQYDSQDCVFVDPIVFPESEFAKYRTGNAYQNYFEGAYMYGDYVEFIAPFDDTWILVIESWFEVCGMATVTYEAGINPRPRDEGTSTTVTKTKTVARTTETVTETETVPGFGVESLIALLGINFLLYRRKQRIQD